ICLSALKNMGFLYLKEKNLLAGQKITGWQIHRYGQLSRIVQVKCGMVLTEGLIFTTLTRITASLLNFISLMKIKSGRYRRIPKEGSGSGLKIRVFSHTTGIMLHLTMNQG